MMADEGERRLDRSFSLGCMSVFRLEFQDVLILYLIKLGGHKEPCLRCAATAAAQSTAFRREGFCPLQ